MSDIKYTSSNRRMPIHMDLSHTVWNLGRIRWRTVIIWICFKWWIVINSIFYTHKLWHLTKMVA